MSKDGAVFQWQYVKKPSKNGEADDMSDEDDVTNMQWRITERHYFMQSNAKVNCAAFDAEHGILVVGFSSGIFGLYEMPDFNMIHTLR